MAKTKDAVDEIAVQWRRELPDLEAENMILIGRLKRCAAVAESELDKVFAAHGLGGGLFDVLAALRRSGAPYTLTPTELYSSLMVTSGTMSTRLKKLEAEGWIERLPNPQDARSMLVRLTDSGKTLVEKAVYPHVANEKRLLDKLDGETRLILERGLAALLRAWEGGTDEAV